MAYLSKNLQLNFIKPGILVEIFYGYIPGIPKHIILISKVNHVARFNGPIFHDENLEYTLPLEIPIAYSQGGLW